MIHTLPIIMIHKRSAIQSYVYQSVSYVHIWPILSQAKNTFVAHYKIQSHLNPNDRYLYLSKEFQIKRPIIMIHKRSVIQSYVPECLLCNTHMTTLSQAIKIPLWLLQKFNPTWRSKRPIFIFIDRNKV